MTDYFEMAERLRERERREGRASESEMELRSEMRDKKMALIQPDFTEVVELKPGEHKMRITNAVVKMSQAGNQYVEWMLTTFGMDDERLNGKQLRYRTTLTGPGAGRLRDFVRAATGELPVGAFDSDALMGRELVGVVVEGRDQNGQPSGWPEVKSVKRLA